MGIGAHGHLAILEKWALEKNGRQEKWAQLYGQLVTRANGCLGHLIGQTKTFETDAWALGQVGIGGKWGTLGNMNPGKMSAKGKRVFAANGHFGA